MEICQINKSFYDQTAAVYDLADGRRSPQLEIWLSAQLKALADQYGNDRLLDMGCGTGFAMKTASPYFKQIIGVDISSKMLNHAQKYGRTIQADIAHLPSQIKNKSFNVVVCFASLHHCFQTQPVFNQAYKILKPKGCFYSDHDLEAHFAQNYKLPLSIYRALRNPARRYTQLVKNLDKDLYEKTEHHSAGLDALKITKELNQAGFTQCNLAFHWFGLNRFTDIIFKQHQFKLGRAPLLAIKAVK